MDQTLTLQFDGGSRGNPGPAGIGVVLTTADGTALVTLGRYIGPATNNVAEYRALITAMEEALKLQARRVIIRGDSELVIKQMRGEYRVKNPAMKALYDKAQALIAQFDLATIEHNLRHKNELADTLANLAMDRRKDVTDVPGASAASLTAGESSALDGPSPVAPKPGDRFACPRCRCSIELLTPSGLRPHQLKAFVCQCGAKMIGQ